VRDYKNRLAGFSDCFDRAYDAVDSHAIPVAEDEGSRGCLAMSWIHNFDPEGTDR
jgi:hypothetical protein